jgi:hypothetical protein
MPDRLDLLALALAALSTLLGAAVSLISMRASIERDRVQMRVRMRDGEITVEGNDPFAVAEKAVSLMRQGDDAPVRPLPH